MSFATSEKTLSSQRSPSISPSLVSSLWISSSTFFKSFWRFLLKLGLFFLLGFPVELCRRHPGPKQWPQRQWNRSLEGSAVPCLGRAESTITSRSTFRSLSVPKCWRHHRIMFFQVIVVIADIIHDRLSLVSSRIRVAVLLMK